ncbi:MAG: hypothetical protein P4L74_03405 [Candidatus Doudnabacteria bacterium]|nr:hypothetical protein [Candidatus Doudnabacteria bacterium]
MGYTEDFIKAQETPSSSPHGYLQGSLPLAAKYNPKGLRKFTLLTYTLFPLAIISIALALESTQLWLKLLSIVVFLLSLWGIYKFRKTNFIKPPQTP